MNEWIAEDLWNKSEGDHSVTNYVKLMTDLCHSAHSSTEQSIRIAKLHGSEVLVASRRYFGFITRVAFMCHILFLSIKQFGTHHGF